MSHSLTTPKKNKNSLHNRIHIIFLFVITFQFLETLHKQCVLIILLILIKLDFFLSLALLIHGPKFKKIIITSIMKVNHSLQLSVCVCAVILLDECYKKMAKKNLNKHPSLLLFFKIFCVILFLSHVQIIFFITVFKLFFWIFSSPSSHKMIFYSRKCDNSSLKI